METVLRVFLSSTFVDLRDTRERIRSFLAVLESDLISMEFFGSDESRPIDVCLRELDRCNVFVGFYAHRYGTIDPATGLSLTELEYDRASELEAQGKLLGLLTYLIDPSAVWPVSLVDDPRAQIEALKSRIAAERTPDYFSSPEDLPLRVLRDVVKRLGLTARKVFHPTHASSRPKATQLARPVGMEYYTPELADFFFGRDDSSQELFNQVLLARLSILLGSSGVGKTSLINAGLTPLVTELGWRVAVVRPAELVHDERYSLLWRQLLEGTPPETFDLAAVLLAIADAHQSDVLIVFDQFEEVLQIMSPKELAALGETLRHFHVFGPNHLRFLFSYRSDVEGRLGPTWQAISGSPEGLPRVYLGPLDVERGVRALSETIKTLNIKVHSETTTSEEFLSQLLEDLVTESALAGYEGVYPPYLQILILAMARRLDSSRTFSEASYASAGGCHDIVARFLLSQLQFASGPRDVARAALLSLASSFGTKTQKDLADIASETARPVAELEKALRGLVDLRLVRETAGRYEVVHDYLANLIMKELATTDETETKKFYELLTIRAASYPQTQALLTRSEHVHIYNLRDRFLTHADERTLLLRSFLAGNGPVAYWLRSQEPAATLAWLRPFWMGASTSETADPTPINALVLALQLGERVPLAVAARIFRRYELGAHLAAAIHVGATAADTALLVDLQRSRTIAVAMAAERAVLKYVSFDDAAALARLAASRSPATQGLLATVVSSFALEMDEAAKIANERKTSRSLVGIHALAASSEREHFDFLHRLRTDSSVGLIRRLAAMRSQAAIASRLGLKDELERLWAVQDPEKLAFLEGLCPADDVFGVTRLLDEYKPVRSHFARSLARNPSEVLYRREVLNPAITAAVRRLARREDRLVLRAAVEQLPLGDPGARDLLRAYSSVGERGDFAFLVEKVCSSEDSLYFNAPSLLIEDIAATARRSDIPWLRAIIADPGFMERRRSLRMLDVRNESNDHLVKRIVGVAATQVSGRPQMTLLRTLLEHPYWTIYSAAANRIAELGDESTLQEIVDQDLATGTTHEGVRLAAVLLDQRQYGAMPFELLRIGSVARAPGW